MNLDWNEMFVPAQPILDVVIRGTIIYLVLFFVFRVLMRRRAGGLSMADVLVVVLIADASQNAMGSEYKSVTEGVALVLTIVFLDFALDWLSQHVEVLGTLTQPPPLILIREGRMLPANMRQEMITRDELLSQLRQSGIDDVKKVRCAFLEGDGRVSVISKDGKEVNPPKEKGESQAH